MVPIGGRQRFEQAFAASVGANHAIAFAHASVGFRATLEALRIRNQEIVLPALSCPTMLEAVVASGNRAAFADIGHDHYNMDPAALGEALTGRTRVVVATHLYGYRADVPEIRRTVGDDRVLVVEDCAQRMPPGGETRPAFSGDVAIFSLGRSKPMCTVRGGIVATRSDELGSRIRDYRERHLGGLTPGSLARLWALWAACHVVYRRHAYGAWQRWRASGSSGAGSEALDPGHSVGRRGDYGFANFQGRIGCRQLARIDAMVGRRRELARFYDRGLRDTAGVRAAPVHPDATYTFYTVRVPGRDDLKLVERLRECGVMTARSFPRTLAELDQDRDRTSAACPQALQASREVLNLPLHPHLDPADIEYVVDSLRRILESR